MLIFVIVFFRSLHTTLTIIGWADYKRGDVRLTKAVTAHVNPFFKDLSKAIILIAKGKNKEAAEIMKKWT